MNWDPVLGQGRYHQVKKDYIGLFARLLLSPDREIRVLIGLCIGCHWSRHMRNGVPDCISFWQRLQADKPVNISDLTQTI